LLPELEVQYADYTLWQRGWLQGEALEKQLAYWKGKLAGAPPVLELPTDRPRPPEFSYRGANVQFTIAPAVVEALGAVARREGVTLYMVLLAAFKVLLTRWSGQTDIVVGSDIAGRQHRVLEPLIGFFVNTLVMRTDLGGAPSFRTLLGRVRETALEAYAHQDLPFEKLVSELEPLRDRSHQPLYQVMFVMHGFRNEVGAWPGLRVSPVARERTTAKFDLSMVCAENSDGVRGRIEYATDLFDAQTIERMATAFQLLLEGVVADIEQPIDRLPLLTPQAREQLLVEWNDTRADYPRDCCVHELFEQQARSTPDAVAAADGATRLSYRELNARANQLARYLRRRGVGPEVCVSVCLDRSVDLVVALLGVLKAGGAYVPIEPASPAERIEYVLADAGIRVLLTETRYLDRLQAFSTEAACLDRDWPAIAQESVEPTLANLVPTNLAYVIYTSGSTGRPKGVMVPHVGFTNYVVWSAHRYNLTPGLVSLVHTSVAFDLTVTSVFPPLVSGGRLELAASASGVEALRDGLRAGARLIKLTPSHLDALAALQEPWPLAPCTVVVGGEALYHEQLARGANALTTFVNEYGPTETVVGCTIHEAEGAARARGVVPIGRPAPNSQIYVLGEREEPCPVGVPGEIYIGGAQVGRGYLGRPGLTAEKFVPNPWSCELGARLYRTGDRARWLASGDLEYLGRFDFQVKIRGYRIEPQEIEHALLAHPSVTAAIAVASGQPSMHARLVAYVARREGAVLDGAALRSYLRERLPDYMLPAAFVVLDAMPLTTNGKVDRSALPPADTAGPAAGYVAPRTPIEATLAQIWAEVLERDRVGVHDNFFDVGGESILAISVIARAQEAGIRATITELFEYQTIADLAAVLADFPEFSADAPESRAVAPDAEMERDTRAAAVTPAANAEPEVPLTPVQRRNAAEGRERFLNNFVTICLECSVQIDPVLLGRALVEIVRHHDALRLRLRSTDSGWRQFVAPPDVAETARLLECVDISQMESVDDVDRALTTWDERLSAAIDVTTPPLLRAALLERGPAEPQLLIVVHHLACDIVSIGILLRNLRRAYEQLAHGHVAALPVPATSFREWAERLSAYARSERARREAAYWYALPWSQCAALPLGDPNNSAVAGRYLHVSLDESDTELLLRVQRTMRIPLEKLLLAAFADALVKWTGSRVFRIRMMWHGRANVFADADVSETVGWFSTPVPVVLDLRDATDAQSLAGIVAEQMQAVPNEGIGYGVLRYLGDDEVLASRPAPEINFNHLGQQGSLQPGDLFRFRARGTAVDRSYPVSEHEPPRLALITIVSDGRLSMGWWYRGLEGDAAAIESASEQAIAYLKLLISKCQFASVA
jgi:amino acid adenylation domain-containing protein/non-ribosomal peptide synthase protein (TIGR01720 family)